jgi:hypothetical protein
MSAGVQRVVREGVADATHLFCVVKITKLFQKKLVHQKKVCAVD